MTRLLPSQVPPGFWEELRLELVAADEWEALARAHWHRGLFVEAQQARAEAEAARAHVLRLLDEEVAR